MADNYGYSILVQPYCENCLEFQPECLDRAIVSHYIYCEHREKCARMSSHIQSIIEGR